MDKFVIEPNGGNFILKHNEVPRFKLYFSKGRFNKMPQDIEEFDGFGEHFANNEMGVARLMREAGEWLALNYPEFI